MNTITAVPSVAPVASATTSDHTAIRKDQPERRRAVYTVRRLRVWLASQVVSAAHNHDEGDSRPDCAGCAG